MRISLLLLLSLTLVCGNSFGAEPAADQASLDKQLLEAAEHGDTSRIADLIARGANVNARQNICRRFTPLHFAVSNHHELAIRQLFEHGADIRATSSIGQTPFSLCYGRHVDLIEQLEFLAKKSGAIRMAMAGALHPRTGANCKFGEVITPAFVCNVCKNLKQGVLMHDEECMQLCVDQVKLNRDFLGAAYNCDIGLVELLLHKGADINAVDCWDRNAICYALDNEKCRSGCLSMIRYLLLSGIEYESKNRSRNGLVWAAHEARNAEAEDFLKKWIKVRKRLPFCMAMHSRAGANSVAHQWLSQDMFRKIFSYL